MAGEWLKLRKQRSFIWATLCASAIAMVVSALSGRSHRGIWDEDPVGAVDGMLVEFAMGGEFVGLVFGFGLCVWLAREFASGSNYLTLLSVPRRRIVFSARLALFGIVSVVFGAWVALIGTGSASLFLGLDRMSHVVSSPDFWGWVAATLVICVFYALMFLAAATLTRRSLPAVGIVVMLLFVLPSVGMYLWSVGGFDVVLRVLEHLPGSLIPHVMGSFAMPEIPESLGLGGSALSRPAAGLLLAVWSVLFVWGAAWRFARQE